VTVAVKKGIAREAAILYPFEETRKALYEGAKKAMSVISTCKPYHVDLPIKIKVQYLETDPSVPERKLVTKEGTVKDGLHILDF
jgi:D-amino peptidase